MKKIATNQPFFLARTRKNYNLYFIDNCEKTEIDSIIILGADLFGDYYIDEIEKLYLCIKEFPRETCCYLVGAKTRVPDYNFDKYRSNKRDKLIKQLIDEILRRSNSILVTDKITQDWLVDFFGYDSKYITTMNDYSLSGIEQSIKNFFWGGVNIIKLN